MLSREGNTNARAASSPGVESNGDMDAGGRKRIADGDGGKSWIARSTLASNSSWVMLLRLEASIVSMNEIEPLWYKLDPADTHQTR